MTEACGGYPSLPSPLHNVNDDGCLDGGRVAGICHGDRGRVVYSVVPAVGEGKRGFDRVLDGTVLSVPRSTKVAGSRNYGTGIAKRQIIVAGRRQIKEYGTGS